MGPFLIVDSATSLEEACASLQQAVPCRISVDAEAGRSRIGLIRPGAMLAGLPSDPTLAACR